MQQLISVVRTGFSTPNPHLIAATRQNSYTRFTLLAIIHCLLDYADAEFTQDTAESNPALAGST